MAVKTFTTGEVLTAADTNTYLNNGGLVYVKQVTVGSAVASVDITSCFSSTYDNYVVSLAGITASNNGVSMIARLLVGTTANAANWDGNTYYVVTGGAGALTNNNLTNQNYAEIGSVTNTYLNAFTFQVNQPNRTTGSYINFSSADNNYLRFGAYFLKNSTAYDGIRILPFAGTLTGGTITIYGYRLG